MNKTIITFKAITSDRRIVTRNITIENEFEIIPAQKWRGIDLPPTSIEEQVMNMLDESDKNQIMIDYDFDIILDYYPKKPRKKKADAIAEEMTDFVRYYEPIIMLHPSFKRPYEAIISEYKDFLFGKRKSHKTKLEEITKIYEISMKASLGTMNIVQKIFHSCDNKNLLENLED